MAGSPKRLALYVALTAAAFDACDSGTGPAGFPQPELTALSPDSIALGSFAPPLTVLGTGFLASSRIVVDGNPRPTSYVNSTTLQTLLTDADAAIPGVLSVMVVSDSPAVGTSQPLPLTIYEGAPTILGLQPSSAVAGQSSLVLAVQGRRFRSGAVIRWDGVDRPTTYATQAQLTTVLGAADLATAGAHTVEVRQGSTVVDTSFPFTVLNSRPSVQAITPPFTAAGQVNVTLIVDGTGFVPGAVARWNGAPRVTTFISSARLTVALHDSDLTNAGSAAVTVSNPDPAQGPSAVVPYAIHVAGWHNLAMDVGDVIWDPVRGVLYASVLDTDSKFPNRVVAVDPMSGQVLRSLVVGSNPKRLAISDDASVLYVGLDGAASIRPIDLATFTARPAFAVGVYQTSGKILYADDIEVRPGHPGTIAVTLYAHGDWTGEGPIAEVMIFDQGVARRLSTWSGNMIEFTSPDTLYGVGSGGYARIGVIQLALTDSGAVQVRSVSDLFGIDGGDFDYGNGTIFTAGGGVIDLPEVTARAPLALGGNVAVDASTRRVFYMLDTTLTVIDASTLQLIGTEVAHGMAPVGQSYYDPKPLIRWGIDGVAYRTYGHLVIFRTSLAVP
jgi:hypothetical protein